MRVCFVTSEYVTEPSFSGGLANYLGRVTTALVERGHEVHVLTRAGKAGVIDYKGVRVHRVVPKWDQRMILDHVDPLIPRRYYNAYQDLKAAVCIWRYWKQLRCREPFDVVQVANVMAVGLCFRWERRVPVVTRLSSYRPTWDTLAGLADRPGTRLRWAMERWAVKGTRYVYAPSRYVAQEAEQHYRVNQVQVVETPFFREEVHADTSVYDSQLRGREYLLFFGRMTQMKGVHVLAEALATCMASIADMHAVFIGGEGPAPDGRGMKAFVLDKLAAFADRVHVHDRMRHDQLYPIVQHARVVAIPSLVDNLPNTCLEAMGLGRVVVATTGSCFEQLITDSRSGFLAPPNDPVKLGDAIVRAWNMTDEDRRIMGEQAAARIAELHPDRAIPRLLDYYQSVIDRAKGNGRA